MKQTPLRIILISTSIIFGLSGCSMFSKMLTPKKIDYQSAQQIPALDVPPDLTSPTVDSHFQVSDSASTTSTTYSAYSAAQHSNKMPTGSQPANCTAPSSSTVLPAPDTIKLERAGSERWLVVNQSPDQLWPQLKSFWQDNGFIIPQSDPATGIMETGWTEHSAKIPPDFIRNTVGKLPDGLYATSQRDSYRTRIERSPTNSDQTEIYISYRGMTEVNDNSSSVHTIWLPSPPNPGLEAEMLTRLMVRLGVTQAKADAMLAAHNGADRAVISQSSDGTSILVDNEPFDQAWQRVGMALDRVGYPVLSSDHSKGIYFVHYVGQNQDNATKPGFFSKLMFWDSSNQQYQIVLTEDTAATNTAVSVLGSNGKPVKPEISNKIINLLLAQLK